MHAIDQKFIMQMWAGRVAGRANCADQLSLPDGLVLANLFVVEVQILCYIGVAVLNKHIVAIGFAVSRGDDFTITR